MRRTSQRRLKAEPPGPAVPEPQLLVDNTEVDHGTVSVNTSGLAALPGELILEIMSHYPRPADPTSTNPSGPGFEIVDGKNHKAWREALLALSQTSRNLRLLFRPHLWRRIEVGQGMYIGEHILPSPYSRKDVQKRHNTELVRQLEVVTVLQPSLAECVRVVNVEVTDYSIRKILAQLARCMSLFPNLKLVTLFISPLSQVDVISTVTEIFSEYSYPQIQSVALAASVYPFLSSCPKMRSVAWIGLHYTTMGQPCSTVESLSLHFPDRLFADRFFPNVQTVHLRCFPHEVSAVDFASLSSLRLLKKVEIAPLIPIDDAVKQKVVNFVTKILLDRQKEDGGEKEVTIHYTPESSTKSRQASPEFRIETTYLKPL